MTDLPRDQADKALAGEFVLGLLEPAEAAAAQARIATEPSFAAEVSAWSERMAPLILGNAVSPPSALWSRIEHSLRPETGQDNRPNGAGFWKGLSLVSTAAALILGFMLINQGNDTPVTVAAPKPLIAAMGSETGNASMTAAYDTATGTLTITPVALDTGRLYPELWVIPVGGSATSLGIVDGKRPTQHSLPAPLRALMAKGATLAITPEPAGGAPGGKATGPVLASGAITSI